MYKFYKENLFKEITKEISEIESQNDYTKETSIWKDDSGATDHCCNQRDLFTSFKECNIPLSTAGANNVIYAEGIGNIDFIDENGEITTLHEVLYKIIKIKSLIV